MPLTWLIISIQSVLGMDINLMQTLNLIKLQRKANEMADFSDIKDYRQT